MVKKAYAEANRKWLEAKAQEEGVKALDKGIYYNSRRKPTERNPTV